MPVSTLATPPLTLTAAQLINVVMMIAASATSCRRVSESVKPPGSVSGPITVGLKVPPTRSFRKIAKPTASAAAEAVRAIRN